MQKRSSVRVPMQSSTAIREFISKCIIHRLWHIQNDAAGFSTCGRGYIFLHLFGLHSYVCSETGMTGTLACAGVGGGQ